MSDHIIINDEKVCLDKVDGRVPSKGDYREKLKYILQHGKQKTEIITKGIDEMYIELRRNERRANGTETEEGSAPLVDLKLSVGGKELASATGSS